MSPLHCRILSFFSSFFSSDPSSWIIKCQSWKGPDISFSRIMIWKTWALKDVEPLKLCCVYAVFGSRASTRLLKMTMVPKIIVFKLSFDILHMGNRPPDKESIVILCKLEIGPELNVLGSQATEVSDPLQSYHTAWTMVTIAQNYPFFPKSPSVIKTTEMGT